MVTKNEPQTELIEEEIDRSYAYQFEVFGNEEARELAERTIELAKKSMDETYQKHPEKCKRIIEIMEKYNCTQAQWNTIEFGGLLSKLNEIYETLDDIFFLLISAKYKTARILLRKWIELVVISIYFDTINHTDREKFIDVEQMKLGFTKKLKELSDNSDRDAIISLYQELSLYTHNEGKKYGSLLPFYYEDEFMDVYSKINEIQLFIEKLIVKNYNIKI